MGLASMIRGVAYLFYSLIVESDGISAVKSTAEWTSRLLQRMNEGRWGRLVVYRTKCVGDDNVLHGKDIILRPAIFFRPETSHPKS